MNRIDVRLAALKAVGRKALVPFITAGDPSLEATVPVLHALVAAGADVLELGVPFSDPMADGPVIQRSSERALERKAGLRYVLECVRSFRQTDNTTPVVLMGYLNPLEIFGMERFAAQAPEAGVDGVLLVDLPPEEAAPTSALFKPAGLALISLVSPTTADDRLQGLLANAQGYVYYVSFAGVTGAAGLDVAAVGQRVARLRERSPVPVLVGFGIRDAASAAALSQPGDGVVVGSALVERLAAAADPVEEARDFLAPIRQAMDAA